MVLASFLTLLRDALRTRVALVLTKNSSALIRLHLTWDVGRLPRDEVGPLNRMLPFLKLVLYPGMSTEHQLKAYTLVVHQN
jgi:hypothetical protein